MGDVVIVHDESLPRSFWRLGHIQDLIIGKDGKTRGATVEIAGKNRNFTSLNRPLQLLYPLEINHSTELMNTPQETQESENPDRSEDQLTQLPRLQRTAARKGEEKRRQWTRELQD